MMQPGKQGMYEEKLNKILSDSGLPQVDLDKLEQTSDWNIKLLQEKCVGKRVAMWGAGDGNSLTSKSGVLLRAYGTYLQGTVCFIDSNPQLWGMEYIGLPVIAPGEIKKWGIECIVIASSVRWQDAIEKECMKYLPKEAIVRPNIALITSNARESNLYLYMHKLRSDYKNLQDPLSKAKILSELISCYLSIRDFAFAFQFIDEYRKNDYPGANRMASLKQELEELLSEMSDKVSGRRKDMLIFFADRLNRRECERLDMFSCMKQRALNFTDANATGLYTYESMASILLGRMPLEQQIYGNDLDYAADEVPLIKKTKELGYSLSVESIPGYPIFKGEEISISYSSFVSQKLWRFFSTLCENGGKVFTYLYVYESHNPELCGYHPDASYEELLQMLKENNKYYRKYYRDCLRYIDSVFSFYYKMFPKDMYLVVHSDHSFLPTDDEAAVGGRNKLLLQKQYCVEVPFIVQGFELTGEYNGIFSMIYFTDVMLQLLDGGRLELKQGEPVNYQMQPVHSKTWRAELIAEGMEKYIGEVDVYVSGEYICMILEGGSIEIYRCGNLYEDIAGTEEGRRYLEEVRAYQLKRRIHGGDA